MRETEFAALRATIEVMEEARREVRYWEAEDGTLTLGARHVGRLLSDGIDKARKAIEAGPVART